MAVETHKMLEEAFCDNALGQTHSAKGLSILEKDNCQPMMSSILDI
jgi:hypothetical protein